MVVSDLQGASCLLVYVQYPAARSLELTEAGLQLSKTRRLQQLSFYGTAVTASQATVGL